MFSGVPIIYAKDKTMRMLIHLAILLAASTAGAAGDFSFIAGHTNIAATDDHVLTQSGDQAYIDGVALFQNWEPKTCFALGDEFGSQPAAVCKSPETGGIALHTTIGMVPIPDPSWSTDGSTSPTSMFQQLTSGERIMIGGSSIRTSTGLREGWLFNGNNSLYEEWGLPSIPGGLNVESWINDITTKAHDLPQLSYRGVGGASWANASGSWSRGYVYDGFWRGLPQTHYGDQYGNALAVSADFEIVVGRSGPSEATSEGAVWFENTSGVGFPTGLPIPPSCATPGPDERATAIDEFSSGLRAIGGTSCGKAAIAFPYANSYVTRFVDLRELLVALGTPVGPESLDTVTSINSERYPYSEEIDVKGACTNGGVACSYEATIDLPEPDTGLALACGAGMLGLLVRRKECPQ